LKTDIANTTTRMAESIGLEASGIFSAAGSASGNAFMGIEYYEK
jgi:hypothetical protein